MSVSSFVHHRLENGHGRDTGTTAAIVLLITVLRSCMCSVNSSAVVRVPGAECCEGAWTTGVELTQSVGPEVEPGRIVWLDTSMS